MGIAAEEDPLAEVYAMPVATKQTNSSTNHSRRRSQRARHSPGPSGHNAGLPTSTSLMQHLGHSSLSALAYNMLPTSMSVSWVHRSSMSATRGSPLSPHVSASFTQSSSLQHVQGRALMMPGGATHRASSPGVSACRTVVRLVNETMRPASLRISFMKRRSSVFALPVAYPMSFTLPNPQPQLAASTVNAGRHSGDWVCTGESDAAQTRPIVSEAPRHHGSWPNMSALLTASASAPPATTSSYASLGPAPSLKHNTAMLRSHPCRSKLIGEIFPAEQEEDELVTAMRSATHSSHGRMPPSLPSSASLGSMAAAEGWPPVPLTHALSAATESAGSKGADITQAKGGAE